MKENNKSHIRGSECFDFSVQMKTVMQKWSFSLIGSHLIISLTIITIRLFFLNQIFELCFKLTSEQVRCFQGVWWFSGYQLNVEMSWKRQTVWSLNNIYILRYFSASYWFWRQAASLSVFFCCAAPGIFSPQSEITFLFSSSLILHHVDQQK